VVALVTAMVPSLRGLDLETATPHDERLR
jgi:hypothetical protein